jgi:hypothetical protein
MRAMAQGFDSQSAGRRRPCDRRGRPRVSRAANLTPQLISHLPNAPRPIKPPISRPSSPPNLTRSRPPRLDPSCVRCMTLVETLGPVGRPPSMSLRSSSLLAAAGGGAAFGAAAAARRFRRRRRRLVRTATATAPASTAAAPTAIPAHAPADKPPPPPASKQGRLSFRGMQDTTSPTLHRTLPPGEAASQQASPCELLELCPSSIAAGVTQV